MREMALAKRISVAIGCVLVAACGGGSSGSGVDSAPPLATNSPPHIVGAPPVIAQVGQPYEFAPTATDADGDTLTFAIENRPEWATFSPITGKLEGTPPPTASPVYPRIRISVSDGKAISELPAFDLSVPSLPSANTAPTIGGQPARSVVVGNSYEFIPQVSDADGQTLAFLVTGKPVWAQFDSATGRLWGTPTAADIGTHGGIEISVSDGVARTALPVFDIAVTGGSAPGPANRAPAISGAPATSVAADQAYSFRPVASDPDGQALTFSIGNKPSWVTFNASTGQLSGTPTAANIGPHSNITITVSDGAASASLPAFSITVVANNNPPDIGGTPPTAVSAGQSYSFTPIARDPDGHSLTFSIVNKPAWGSFSRTTGRLSGKPTADQAGSYANVLISVTDGIAQDSLPPFTVVVDAPNRPPVISGSPLASVSVGRAFDFTPVASDPDGQPLTFSIANKPSWAAFNTSSGRLNGTPSVADAGSYAGVVISVSDGTDRVSLPSFTLTVQQVQHGSATVSWTPPTANTDNSPLVNLRGYRIHYGTASGNLNQRLDLPTPGITSAVVEDLAPGTWYFAVTAYNTSNVESALSNVRSKVIN